MKELSLQKRNVGAFLIPKDNRQQVDEKFFEYKIEKYSVQTYDKNYLGKYYVVRVEEEEEFQKECEEKFKWDYYRVE